MVLVASGPHGSGNASGSIGADTYSHNRFGQYVRNRTKPVNPNSERQAAVRSALALLTDAWAHTLLPTDRANWEDYAKNVVMKNRLGEDILLTGFNHFIRSNVWPVMIGGPFVGASPVIFELPAQDPKFAVAASEATQTLTFTFDDTRDWAVEANARLICYMGLPQNLQRNFFGGPWRHVGFIHSLNGAAVTPHDFAPIPYHVAVGQKIWCYGRIRRADARLSAPFSCQADIGA